MTRTQLINLLELYWLKLFCSGITPSKWKICVGFVRVLFGASGGASDAERIKRLLLQVISSRTSESLFIAKVFTFHLHNIQESRDLTKIALSRTIWRASLDLNPFGTGLNFYLEFSRGNLTLLEPSAIVCSFRWFRASIRLPGWETVSEKNATTIPRKVNM